MIPYKKGQVVKGTVTGIEKYGAFISLDEYYTGLIHISEVSRGFVRKITDFVNVGDIIYVEVLNVDDELYQLRLSIKNIDYKRQTKIRKKKIIETSLGFRTLAYKLPFWIDKNLKKQEKTIK